MPIFGRFLGILQTLTGVEARQDPYRRVLLTKWWVMCCNMRFLGVGTRLTRGSGRLARGSRKAKNQGQKSPLIASERAYTYFIDKVARICHQVGRKSHPHEGKHKQIG